MRRFVQRGRVRRSWHTSSWPTSVWRTMATSRRWPSRCTNSTLTTTTPIGTLLATFSRYLCNYKNWPNSLLDNYAMRFLHKYCVQSSSNMNLIELTPILPSGTQGPCKWAEVVLEDGPVVGCQVPKRKQDQHTLWWVRGEVLVMVWSRRRRILTEL